MKILALDTSSKNASVAILEDETILIQLNNSDEKTHSQKLMPMIDEAFQKTNLALEDISLIACGLGPGSFTGVRIGIATAKAFADSKNIATTRYFFFRSFSL
ncbi:MAG: tRNA (adenosine(37)-N6)-threonylcarbamoyltransferase complex dimerization subunit type 1 TsaB [Clostridia bacterium]|nr:tRNA (adenosine(37)-N6)-threonylcarbamoyltransferase complex dimerization subunit type 1 TsaB [Clostridia bacterium]